MGAIYGFLGHSFVDLAGQNVMGAPIMMGIMDMGMVLGGTLSYNHSGAIGSLLVIKPVSTNTEGISTDFNTTKAASST